MSYSKRQFVNAAFEEIGLANYVFDMQPEQLQGAVRRLDAMMAEWNGKGIRLSYPMPGSPEDSDLEAETNVPDRAYEAIICSLAVRIAPGFGKTPMPDTKARAKSAYNTVLMPFAMPSEMQFPDTLPSGAGNKSWRYDQPFMLPPAQPIEAGPDGSLEFT